MLNNQKFNLIPQAIHRGVSSPSACLTLAELEHDLEDAELYFVMVADGHIAASEEDNLLTTHAQNLLAEFENVFLEELSMGLPHSRSIQHQLNLIPSTSIPNRPH